MNSTVGASHPGNNGALTIENGTNAINDASATPTKNWRAMNGVFAPHVNGQVYEGPVAVDEVIEQLRRAMVDELCALRGDIDVLKKGGWKVDVGRFQQTIEQTQGDREQFCQAITDRIKSKISVPAPALTKVEESESMGAATKLQGTSHESAEPWKPAYIRTLTPLTGVNFLGSTSMVTFTWDFLQRIFHGAIEHSPGLYYVPLSAGGSLTSSRTFYAISSTHEPFLPSTPCAHGAKMTAFFNPDAPEDGGETAYEDIPLFISAADEPGKYTYFGTYSQTRWSDHLGHNDIATHVPTAVKEFWAAQLADPARPAWVTKALKKHFFPMPEYEGPMPQSAPNGSAVTGEGNETQRRVQKAVKNYVEEMRLWEDEANSMVGLMEKEDMVKAFENADADESPGLRLWWEYLECKEWDKGFYDMLVREQVKFNARR